jgi:hypothetical protein
MKSSGNFAPFLELHVVQAGTTLSALCLPPRESGIM